MTETTRDVEGLLDYLEETATGADYADAHKVWDAAEELRAEIRRLRSECDEIATVLGVEYEDEGPDDRRWWLPAEPGPIECETLAEAVEQLIRLAENEVGAKVGGLRSELERRDAALREIVSCYESDDPTNVALENATGIARRALATGDDEPKASEMPDRSPLLTGTPTPTEEIED